MVARIKTPSAITRALNYNEQKVKQGHAVLLFAGNYLKDAHELNFKEKLKRFQDLITLNDRAKTNSLHISLNFDSADNLSVEKCIDIGTSYMNKIGFAEQPYLIYQHNDAGHPHIHIVTTTIKEDGRRIDTFNIGRNQSEKARKEIENEFHLIKAENKRQLKYDLKPVDAQKVQYGRTETRRAITNVLEHVLSKYKYASLAELNAILQQYNIMADRGSEQSNIYKGKGLVYRILDGNGKKIGVPVKASLIYNNPTLKNIEANFEKNRTEKQANKRRVTNAVDLLLLKNSRQSLRDLIQALQKENIHVVLRQNESGIIYGITYVDHHTKCVFNGSELGKQYSANAIQQRCNSEQKSLTDKHQFLRSPIAQEKQDFQPSPLGFTKAMDDLIQPEENQFANEPPEQRKFKKRKRKQKHSHN